MVIIVNIHDLTSTRSILYEILVRLHNFVLGFYVDRLQMPSVFRSDYIF